MTAFVPPPWTLGTGAAFRISASAVAGRHSRFGCPAKVSLGARNAVSSLQPNDPSRWRRRWDDASTMHFAIRDAHTDVAHGVSITKAVARSSKLTAPQRRFVIHALHHLVTLEELVTESAGVPMRLDADVDYSGRWGAITVFGAQFVSDDGTIRELVRLRIKAVHSTDHPEVAEYVAVAGWVLAKGLHPSFATTSPERIRISEFSLDTGDYGVLSDTTRGAAEAAYVAAGRPVQAALDDQRLKPGSGCADCAFLNVCPAVPGVRGVLGLPGRSVATRALTATDLAAYDRCPTAFHVQRRDHLPAAPPEEADTYGSMARTRGIAVHAWLSWAHSRDEQSGCTDADLPDPASDRDLAVAAAARAGLGFEEYCAAWPYLRGHLELCLLGYAGLDRWRTEPVHVAYDADADIVVVSSPDLTCRLDAGAALWRETKTSTVLPPDVEAALDRYPAFALDVAMLTAGVDANTGTDGAVELEVLTATGAAVFYVPLADGTLVSYAQKIVARIGHSFSRDLTFGPQPSALCHSCDAYGWCLPKDVPDAAPTVDDHEFIDHPDPF